MANPVRYYFREVKKSAKKRGIPCGLTFEEFEKFDRETGYTKGVGTGPDDLTIDRVDPARGYESGNLRALTHRANSARLVEGITDPRQPIAEALALVAGKGKNWRSYLRLSEDVLLKVDLINKQALPSDLDVPEGNCPF